MPFLQTEQDMMRALSPKMARFFFNIAPCIRGSGGRVVAISDDFTRLRVRLKLNWRTRNLVGTIFGGSMYAAIDPFYMLMLMRILGSEYVVWDKGCTIRFKRPARETLFADFHISDEMLAAVRQQVALEGEGTFTWPLALKGPSGTVYAEFDKVIYVARKNFYETKAQRRRLDAKALTTSSHVCKSA
jgi:acyl-coenzyme A thioesterase PaaI-like protein